MNEIPSTVGEPYYPIPTKENHIIYHKYKKEAKKYLHTYLIGRLAQYRYFNMDQVIEEALNLFRKIEKLEQN